MVTFFLNPNHYFLPNPNARFPRLSRLLPATSANFPRKIKGFQASSSRFSPHQPPPFLSICCGDGTVTFNGGNYFFIGGLNIGGLNLAAGTVTLGDHTALAATGGTELSLGRTGVTLDLDYDGQMPFKSLAVGGKERAAGVYSATQGRMSVRSLLAGDGELLILEGTDPATVISIR